MPSRRTRKAVPETGTLALEVREVRRGPRSGEGFEPVTLVTERGEIELRHYPAPDSGRAAVFVGGAGGGFDTPVRGWLYPRLCEDLQREDVSGLRVRYRHPNDLVECTLDVLAAVQFLIGGGANSIALCGHSFGGAVVIRAAAAAQVREVRTCVALSTQTFGTRPAALLGPRCSLLLAHGEADEVLPSSCSEYVFRIAQEPKRLLLKGDVGHGLDEWAGELPDLLRDWIRTELGALPAARSARRRRV